MGGIISGPIAIHAGLKDMIEILPKNVVAEIHSALCWKGCYSKYKDLPHGCIIATAELVDCVEIYQRGRPKEYADQTWLNYSRGDGWCDDRQVIGNELLFGDFTPGRFAWEFKNVTLLPEPIPAKGRQGLWNWNGAEHEA